MEEIEIDEDSLAFLGEVGQQISLRHAIQLLSTARVVAKANGRESRSARLISKKFVFCVWMHSPLLICFSSSRKDTSPKLALHKNSRLSAQVTGLSFPTLT